MTSLAVSRCSGCSISRRRFLKGCGTACVSGVALATSSRAAQPPRKKLRIRLVYLVRGDVDPHSHILTNPGWPNVGYDFSPIMNTVERRIRSANVDIDLAVSRCTSAEQAKALAGQDEQAGDIDGYVVYQLSTRVNAIAHLAATGKPTLYANLLYASEGTSLASNSNAVRRFGRKNYGFVNSSQWDDFGAAVDCFGVVARGGSPEMFAAAVRKARRDRTPAYGNYELKEDAVKTIDIRDWLAQMKETKILTFGGQGWGGTAAPMREFGMDVKEVSFAELNEAWETADRDQAKEVATTWKNSAEKIEGVSFETLESSAAMYLAQQAMLKRYHADGLTINCLGGFYGDHIHAYPCLGFHQLTNDGIVGACECDLVSAVTMLALTKLTQGRTGFISDPVIDTSKRQIIYAHCVAFNRPFGPAGPANPFEIHTHSEDRNGASVRSLLPAGYMTTTIKMLARSRTILLHQAAAVDNIIEDMACRTKLAGEVVGDIEKLIAGWGNGWHRVTVYGDLKEQVHEMADALGWRVLKEA